MRLIQYIQLASSALLITLLAGCQTLIPLDLGDNTPRIVINAVATEQQGIDISLSESKPTGVASPSTNVYYPYDHPDCPYRMTLKVNDQLVPLSEVAQYKPQTGDRIAISVEKPGLKVASAVTTVPARQEPSYLVGEQRFKRKAAERSVPRGTRLRTIHPAPRHHEGQLLPYHRRAASSDAR